ncbi:unnamed protein product [Linum tenue]|uniref:Uncharacterized protein n=1 Tax=Linum tenue TaxID=586396 RepID=A0AAV0RVJ1_9ROSI|nr:unnamed protein product [Linum tenue]
MKWHHLLETTDCTCKQRIWSPPTMLQRFYRKACKSLVVLYMRCQMDSFIRYSCRGGCTYMNRIEFIND